MNGLISTQRSQIDRGAALVWSPILKPLLAIMILAVIMAVPAAAQVSLNLTSGSATPGGTVTLQVGLNSSGSQPSAVQWTVMYPTSDIVSVSAAPGAAATAAGKTVACQGGSGSYTCVVAGNNGTAIMNGTLATLTFRLASGTGAGTIPIEITRHYSSSAAGSAMSCSGSGSVITALQPATLSSLNCSPTSLTPPGTVSCSLGLSGPAPAAGAAVSVSDNSSSLSVPATVNVPAGGTSATFSATATAVTAATNVTITASYGGVSRTASVTLQPQSAGTIVSLAGLTCTPSSLTPPGSISCTVALTAPATSATAVSLSDNSAAISVPASVTVAGGAASAAFTATASAVTSNSTATITASALGGSKTASVQLLAPASTPAPTEMAGYWPFEEGAGTSTADLSGNGRTATLQGAQWTTSGKSGNALSFNGRDSYVNAGTFDLTGNAMSISAWFKVNSFPAGSDARIISKARGAGEQDHIFMFSLYTGYRQALRLRLKTDGTTKTLIAPEGPITAGVWVHAVATYDGTTARLYKDGVQVGSMPMSGAITTDSSVPVWIGLNPDGSNPFDGLIDQVRVYNRALSPAEIQALAQSDSAPTIPVAVSVSPTAASLTASQSRQFIASVTGTSNTAVTWSVSPAVGTITQSGLYTAPASITAPATVTVRAASAADPTKFATAVVTLNPTVSVAVTPSAVTLAASATQQFTASVSGSTNTAVTWSLSPAVGTISASGLYTAPASVASATTVTVKAVSAADSTKSATAVVTLAPSAPATPGGLIRYWMFSEGRDSVAADSSGSQVTGTVRGATWTTAGRYGNALYFDGRNDYVDVAQLNVPGNAITISAWFKADSFPAGHDARILSKATGEAEQDHHIMLSLYAGYRQALRLRLKTNGTTKTLIAPQGPITTGVWVHAVATYDGTTARLYKDGVEVGSMPLSGTLEVNSKVPAFIGANPKGPGNNFHGTIDQVRVYNRALSQQEIQSLYQAGQ